MVSVAEGARSDLKRMFVCQLRCTKLVFSSGAQLLRPSEAFDKACNILAASAKCQSPWPYRHVNTTSWGDDGETKANNPLFSANQYVKEPIFQDNDIIFRPMQFEVRKAAELFRNGRKHTVKFVKGAYHPQQAPEYSLPEIAMLGQSNVGKSSLIKALFHDVPGLTVRTSKTPGHTKLLLFYQAGSAFSLVDLPGYGVRQPENFGVTAEGYLRTRKNLQMAFLLIDILEGFQPMDLTAVRMLEDFSRPYSVVITKADRASPRKLVTSLCAIREVIQKQTTTCLPQPFLVSATRRRGMAFLQSYIAHITQRVRVS